MKSVPLPNNENDRIKVLKSYHVLDTGPEIDFDELTILASEICKTPIALISLVDESRQWFKSRIGIDDVSTPKEQAFCAHAIMRPYEMMVIPDARSDERFSANPLVTDYPNIVFYAGVPLISDGGYPLGTLCVIDREPKELTETQVKSLKILAKQVMNQLDLRKKLFELNLANQELEEANAFIRKFASVAAHDIKNPLSSIMMSSQLLERRLKPLNDEKSLNLVENTISSSKKLLNLVEHMLEYSIRPGLLTSAHTDINLNILLSEICEMVVKDARVVINLPASAPLIRSSIIALEQIFLNLLTNAIRYNDKDEVRVNIHFEDFTDKYQFRVIDNGIGINEVDLERIFDHRFTLGKHDRFNQKGTGIGLTHVRTLIEKLGGKISVSSNLGEGSEFIFSILKM